MENKARGLRNNNPGNIRKSSVVYLGEVHPSTDTAFKQFVDPKWGYRAMFVLLHTYRQRYGLDTIRKMVGRYAPPNENHTNAYVESVAKWSGVNADTPIDTRHSEVMIPIVAAMSRVENGCVADLAEVQGGWVLFR